VQLPRMLAYGASCKIVLTLGLRVRLGEYRMGRLAIVFVLLLISGLVRTDVRQDFYHLNIVYDDKLLFDTDKFAGYDRSTFETRRVQKVH
jgi:hypothetical protein